MFEHNSAVWMLLYIPAAVFLILLLANTMRLQMLSHRQKREDNLDFNRDAAWRRNGTKVNPEFSSLSKRVRLLTLLTVVASLLALNARHVYVLLTA